MSLIEYLEKYDNLKKKIVFYHGTHSGGLGDYIKYFCCLLNLCIKNNIKIYIRISKNNYIQNYIKLKFDKMNILDDELVNKEIIKDISDILNLNENIYYIISLNKLYDIHSLNIYDKYFNNIQDIFYFSNEVIVNSIVLLPKNINKYISIHLRLGDYYLETDKSNVLCINDKRYYNEEVLFNFIEKNTDINIIFFCDNNSYKLKLKEKYKQIIILDTDIGHTSAINVTDKQALDAVTEFYILTNSFKIYAASRSGFSDIASKFKNTPYQSL